MRIRFLGIGLWSRGMTNFEEFSRASKSQFLELDEAAFEAPKPSALPARERRRCGLMTNVAVEVAHQACEHASVDKRTVPSVFTSSLGDTQIIDYMCKALSEEEKIVSPTKFHNSVHNAASGYWTISAENRAPSSFVCGFEHSFAIGLLEAAAVAVSLRQPTLLVAYDLADDAPFDDLMAISETYGVGVVLAPADVEVPASAAFDIEGTLTYRGGLSPEEQSLPRSERLAQFSRGNPLANSLALVEALDNWNGENIKLSFGAGENACLAVELG